MITIKYVYNENKSLQDNNKQTISNYRPISILYLFSKVIETIMYNTIAKF